MTPERPRRRLADLLLFGITATELGILLFLTSTFTTLDWIYLLGHIVVLGIALTRPAPRTQDVSVQSSAAVAVAYTYPYAQLIYLRWQPGYAASPEAGLVLVTLSAVLSLTSLLTLGRSFGLRPALRGLATRGPYRLVRHPIYLAYVIGDIGYNLQEWNWGTVLLTVAGWAASVYRIRAEERVLAQDSGWRNYATSVRYRLLPGLW